MRLDSLFPPRRLPLLEGKTDYEAMMRDLRMAIDAYTADKAMMPTDLGGTINRARSLGRADRVIWYLRYARIRLADMLSDLPSITLYDGRAFDPKKYRDSLVQDFLARAAKDRENNDTDSPSTPFELNLAAGDLLRNSDAIQHFLSLPIPAIQNYVFTYQHPLYLIGHFSNLEQKWQESRRGLVELQRGDMPLIKFNDRRAWWLLDRNVCKAEGDAMGHCGNAGDPKPGDRLLSLRDQVEDVGGKPFYKPYLTFVLRSDGRLGEMKARFNMNPKIAAQDGVIPSDFQREIAALLMHRMVTGIKGGGFEVDKNFKMDDLEPELREKLYAEKPGLMSLTERMNRDLLDHADVASQFAYLVEGLEGGNNIAWLPDRKMFRIAQFPIMCDLTDELVLRPRRGEKQVAATICGYLTNPDTWPSPAPPLPSQADTRDLLDILEKRHSEVHAALVRHLWDQHPDDMDDNGNPIDDNDGHAYVMMSHKYLDRMVQKAMTEGIRNVAFTQMRRAFEDYIRAFELWDHSLMESATLESEDIRYDVPVGVLASPDQVVKIIEDFLDNEDMFQSMANLISLRDMIEPQNDLNTVNYHVASDSLASSLRKRFRIPESR